MEEFDLCPIRTGPLFALPVVMTCTAGPHTRDARVFTRHLTIGKPGTHLTWEVRRHALAKNSGRERGEAGLGKFVAQNFLSAQHHGMYFADTFGRPLRLFALKKRAPSADFLAIKERLAAFYSVHHVQNADFLCRPRETITSANASTRFNDARLLKLSKYFRQERRRDTLQFGKIAAARPLLNRHSEPKKAVQSVLNAGSDI